MEADNLSAERSIRRDEPESTRFIRRPARAKRRVVSAHLFDGKKLRPKRMKLELRLRDERPAGDRSSVESGESFSVIILRDRTTPKEAVTFYLFWAAS